MLPVAAVFEYLWTSLLVLLFGKTIYLQPSPVIIDNVGEILSTPQVMDVISSRAAIYVSTRELNRLKMTDLIGPNYRDTATALRLDTINFSLRDRHGSSVCTLKFVGFVFLNETNSAVYRCQTADIRGMLFYGVYANSPTPVELSEVFWMNYGA